MKISGNYRFYRGFIEGDESFKAKPYFQGGWGKIRNNLYSRIIRQSNSFMLYPINSIK